MTVGQMLSGIGHYRKSSEDRKTKFIIPFYFPFQAIARLGLKTRTGAMPLTHIRIVCGRKAAVHQYYAEAELC